jgi:hypothetical protein
MAEKTVIYLNNISINAYHNSTPGKENPTVLSTDPPVTMLEGGGEIGYDVTRIASFQCHCSTHAYIAETRIASEGSRYSDTSANE